MRSFVKQFVVSIKSAVDNYSKNKEQERIAREQEELKRNKALLLEFWLEFLNKQMKILFYQGENANVNVINDKYCVIPNVNLKDLTRACNFYDSCCKQCFEQFITCLEVERNIIMKKINTIQNQKNIFSQNIYKENLRIASLEQSCAIEPDRLKQDKYAVQVLDARRKVIGYMTEIEKCNENLERENRNLEILGNVFCTIKKGVRPVGIYYNNQPKNRLFVLGLNM